MGSTSRPIKLELLFFRSVATKCATQFQVSFLRIKAPIMVLYLARKTLGYQQVRLSLFLPPDADKKSTSWPLSSTLTFPASLPGLKLLLAFLGTSSVSGYLGHPSIEPVKLTSQKVDRNCFSNHLDARLGYCMVSRGHPSWSWMLTWRLRYYNSVRRESKLQLSTRWQTSQKTWTDDAYWNMVRIHWTWAYSEKWSSERLIKTHLPIYHNL